MFKTAILTAVAILLSGSVLATSTTAPVKDITPAVAPLKASASETRHNPEQPKPTPLKPTAPAPQEAPTTDITPAVAPLLASAQTTMAKTVSNKYVLATDDDFAGNLNAEFRYIGSAEYVIIPHTIKGAEVTSYNHMFENTKVKGVYSDNPNIDDFGYMFMNNSSDTLEFILDTSNAINMAGMFEGTKAKSLDLSGLDTSNVVYMHRMFRNSSAEALDLRNFNTSKIESISNMFEGSKALTINLSNFDVSKVRDLQFVFKDSRVKTLDLSSFDLSHFTYEVRAHLYKMFEGCEATTGYARNQADADKLNDTDGKPAGLYFKVK